MTTRDEWVWAILQLAEDEAQATLPRETFNGVGGTSAKIGGHPELNSLADTRSSSNERPANERSFRVIKRPQRNMGGWPAYCLESQESNKGGK